jgi:hypothetical protein
MEHFVCRTRDLQDPPHCILAGRMESPESGTLALPGQRQD